MSNTKKSSTGTKTESLRYRNFATVVYPESAPDNWLDIISEAKIAIFISPLHDKDINPNGEPKKPHFHVLAAYEGKKSRQQVADFFSTFGGVGCEIVQSLRGYARYLCHLDNPEKAQYPVDDVQVFGGADYSSTIGLPTDKYKAIREMIAYCEDENIFSFADLLRYASENRFEWFRVLCDSGAVVIREYLKSRTWTHDRKELNQGKFGYNSQGFEGASIEVLEHVDVDGVIHE